MSSTGNMSSQHQQLLTGLGQLYESRLLVDIILAVGNMEVSAHRNVLAASSPYFRAMLTSDLLEVTQKRIQLYDIDGPALQSIVNFMYWGNIKINNDNVQSIFTTASLFEMLALCELCADHMIQELHINNCVSLYQFGAFHHSPRLQSAAHSFVVNHFSDVAESEEILTLSLEELTKLIQDDNLNVRKEEAVFECTVAWVENNLDERLPCVPKLLQHVRFTLMTLDYLSDVVECSELVLNNSFCKSLVNMAKLYKTACEGTDNETESDYAATLQLNVKSRLGMYNRQMLVFMGGSHTADNSALTCFDPATKKNYYAIPLHVSFDFKYRVDYHRAVVTDRNEVYLIGGVFYDDHHFGMTGSALGEVKMFDPYKKAWHNKAPMLYRRCAHALAFCQGQVFAIGGKASYPGGMPTASVEAYRPEQDAWSYVSSMPISLFHHCAVVHHKHIYVVGGATLDDMVTRSFLMYDIQCDAWTSVENMMRVPRAEFGAAVLGSELYVVGGTNGDFKVSSMEIYDFTTGKWRFGVDFPEDRKSMVTVTYNGCIFVCGGVRTLISRVNRTPRLVETKDLWQYNVQDKAWRREARLVQYANIHACVVAEMNTKRLYESEFISSP